MKPPPFDYAAPTTVAAAVSALAGAGGDAKVLAGGQSLVPLLNMRLAAPRVLVDVNRVAELDYVRVDGGVRGATVRVGALARHATVERDQAAGQAVPLLHQALRLVAHPVVRNRGTVVGSLAHADPSGELTAVLALLGGDVVAASATGTRRIPAGEFFVGPLESALRPDELAVEAAFPAPPPGTGTAFVEVARRHGDYAVVGVAAAVTVDDDLRVVAARAAYVSVGPTPVVLDLTEAISGATVATADWPAAGRLAAGRTDPEPDIHASAAYRRHLVAVLTARALRQAAAAAAEPAGGAS